MNEDNENTSKDTGNLGLATSFDTTFTSASIFYIISVFFFFCLNFQIFIASLLHSSFMISCAHAIVSLILLYSSISLCFYYLNTLIHHCEYMYISRTPTWMDYILGHFLFFFSIYEGYFYINNHDKLLKDSNGLIGYACACNLLLSLGKIITTRVYHLVKVYDEILYKQKLLSFEQRVCYIFKQII